VLSLHGDADRVGDPCHDPGPAVSVEPTVADPLIRGSAVLVGAAWVTAPLPAGRASTVASDASAAAASVQSAPIFRVVRIACPFVESDDTGLAGIYRLEPPPYG